MVPWQRSHSHLLNNDDKGKNKQNLSNKINSVFFFFKSLSISSSEEKEVRMAQKSGSHIFSAGGKGRIIGAA